MLAALLLGLATAAPPEPAEGLRTLLAPDGSHLEARPGATPHRLRALPLELAPLRVHGDDLPDARLDLLVLSEAYTRDDEAAFEADVARFVDHLLALEPWSTHGDLLTVRSAFVPSTDRLLDDVEGGTERSTAWECFYGCGLQGTATSRLVCCDGEALQAVADSLGSAADGVLVLSADPRFGGSGGELYAVASATAPGALQVQAHEVSHTLVGLWDEYGLALASLPEDRPGSPNCAPADRDLPWSAWMDGPVDWAAWRARLDADDVDACDGRPTTAETVCAYPVCSYEDWVRPTADACMMHSLQDRYCPVCTEAIVRRLYRALGPTLLTAPQPPTDTPVELTEEATVFSARAARPADALTWTWTLDGQVVGRSPSLSLDPTRASGRTLVLEVQDASGLVRADPGQVTQARLTWTLAGPGCGGCGATGPRGLHALAPLLALLLLRRRP